MSELDQRLAESLPRLTAGIELGAHDLIVVRDRVSAAHRRTRRVVLAAVAAAVVLIIAVGVAFDVGGRLGSVEPIGPAPNPIPSPSASMREIRDPFTVVRTIDPARVGIDRPLKLAVAGDRHVYVSDRAQKITELTATGERVRQWGGAGTGPGKFRLYSGALTVGPDGNVYVADTGNFRIQVFTPAGGFVEQLGGYGQGPGKFVWPSDVEVGRDGTVYVADDRAATITALAPDGRQLWRRGTRTETDPDLVGHEHLGGVDGAGELVTANDDAGKVLYIDAAGHVVDAFSTDRAGAGVDAGGIPGGNFPNGACGATLDSQEDVYVNSCEESYQPQHDTAVYDAEHRLVAGWKRGDLVDSPVFGSTDRAWAITNGTAQALVELAVHLPPETARLQ